MSEGGRKVWNREQLLDLNDGTVILVSGIVTQPDLEPVRIIHLPVPAKRDPKGYIIIFEVFGDEYGVAEPTTYPIDVIWEPTE